MALGGFLWACISISDFYIKGFELILNPNKPR
jgi:hypothetical protein